MLGSEERPRVALVTSWMAGLAKNDHHRNKARPLRDPAPSAPAEWARSKGEDTRLERDVAIKILPTHLSQNPEVRQRFEREARAIS